MTFICEVCAAAVDEMGFKVEPPEIPGPSEPRTCIDCRMEAMRKRSAQSGRAPARKPPSEMFGDDMPAYRPPYKD